MRQLNYSFEFDVKVKFVHSAVNRYLVNDLYNDLYTVTANFMITIKII